MSNTTTVNAIAVHYAKVVQENTREMLRLVLDQVGLPLHPTSVAELRPVPVFENEASSLLQLVNKRIPTTILWPQVPADEFLPAYYKRYRDVNRKPYNKIVVASDNYCVSRFFAAKELMHCSIDDDQYPVTDSFPLLNNLITELAAGPGNFLACAPQTMVDQVAWIGAASFTMPDTWLPILRRLHQDMCQGGMADDLAYRYVAQLIRVPQTILKQRLTHG